MNDYKLKARINRKVLMLLLKADKSWLFLISLGREFHSFGAANANALSPNVARDLPGGGSSNISSLFRRLYLEHSFSLIILQI